MRRLLPLLVLGLLAGCVGTRPAPVACPAFAAATGGPDRRTAAAAEAVEDALMAEMAEADRGGAVRLRVVSLSAGGQFGAFGAGFLAGWSRNPAAPRPVFDVVTGVSAGAILAPVAFAGPGFDRSLLFYRGLGARAVSRPRLLFGLLGGGSVASPAPLEALLRREVTPALVAAIAARYRRGDRLLVAATNLDTTEGEVIDLGALAADPDPARAARCIREAVLASAAIPGLLPPRNVGGALLADGGLRDQVFFRAVDTARARVARRTGRRVEVDAFLVVNGALRPPGAPAADSILGYVGRSVAILADEVLRDSILEAVAFAEGRPGWRLRGVVAGAEVMAACGLDSVPTATFDACVTRVLYDEGVLRGSAVPIAWLDAAALRALAEEL